MKTSTPDQSTESPLLDEQILCAFLAQLEPLAPPPGLVESIEALTLQAPPRASRETQRRTPAWKEARWAVEGPRRGLRTLAIPAYGSRQAWNGVSTLRFALGPLLPERPLPRLIPKPTWWLRQAVRLWR
jgi:hypothetical protein